MGNHFIGSMCQDQLLCVWGHCYVPRSHFSLGFNNQTTLNNISVSTEKCIIWPVHQKWDWYLHLSKWQNISLSGSIPSREQTKVSCWMRMIWSMMPESRIIPPRLEYHIFWFNPVALFDYATTLYGMKAETLAECCIQHIMICQIFIMGPAAFSVTKIICALRVVGDSKTAVI